MNTSMLAGQGMASSQNLAEFLKAGGPIMIPIGVCSVVVLGCLFERLVALRFGKVLPAEFLAAAELVKQGSFEAAQQQLGALDAPAARILLAGLRRRGMALLDVERAIEDQGRKELERMRGNVRPITLMAHVSPLLGLFGTVVGIIESFQQVAKVGMGKPESLAGGIAMALVATLAGLAVAIPGLVLASWLLRRVRRLIAAIDDVVTPLVETIAAGGDASGGRTHAA